MASEIGLARIGGMTEIERTELCERARTLIAQAKTVSDVKEIIDQVITVATYLRRVKASKESIVDLAVIQAWAERRAGQMLKEKPSAAGRPRKNFTAKKENIEKIPDLGIDKNQSVDWQEMADDVSDEEFEETLDEVKATGQPTTKKVVNRIKKKKAIAKMKEAAQEVVPDTTSWEIIHGDCLEVLETVERGSVRLVFADPPYNIGVDYGDGHDDSLPECEYRDWCREWMIACARTLTRDGSMWVMINHEWAADFEFLLRDEVGMTIGDWITWYEAFGVNCTTKFNRTSRRIFHAVWPSSRWVFHPEAVLRPSARQETYGDHRADSLGKVWDDVWQIPRLSGTCQERIIGFPTQLPIDLLRPIIACASDPGDLILDPFSGSATTGVAAISQGRRYFGIERSEEFHGLATARMKSVQGSLSR